MRSCGRTSCPILRLPPMFAFRIARRWRDMTSFRSVCQTSPECSLLSCCNLAQFIPVNSHCLLQTFEEAIEHLESGKFAATEEGPFRIFAVYSLPEVSK